MTRVKKRWDKRKRLDYCTFDPIKCQLSHFQFAVAVKVLVGNLLSAIHFIIACHLKNRANYQKASVVQLDHRMGMINGKI